MLSQVMSVDRVDCPLPDEQPTSPAAPSISSPLDIGLSHYDNIAANYDDLYDVLHHPMAQVVLPVLEFHSDISFADVGGGTGAVAKIIEEMSDCELKNPMCIVDPAVRLIQEASKKPNFKTLIATADEFFKMSDQKYNYDRLLLCQCVHHLPNYEDTFRAMYDFVPSGAICVILEPNPTRLPLWKSLREQSARNLTGMSSKMLCSLMDCGFDVKSFNCELPVKTTKRNWYSKIRQRIFSMLYTLTDKEVEDGIEELDKTILKEVQDDDEIDMIHDMFCIVATKQ